MFVTNSFLKLNRQNTQQQLFHSRAKLKLSVLTLISVTFVVPLFSIQHVMHHETHFTTPIQIRGNCAFSYQQQEQQDQQLLTASYQIGTVVFSVCILQGLEA